MGVLTAMCGKITSLVKSVEPKARCTATAIPNQASDARGKRTDWMASIPLRGMKRNPAADSDANCLELLQAQRHELLIAVRDLFAQS
jgi:hypothetical protein